MASPKEVNIRNKKAKFNYELLDTYDAGIQLTGAEIKSIRMGKASIGEAYCVFKKHELWIKGMHIAPYEPASYNNPITPTRDRKLLLQKRELEKLEDALKNKGLTIIPTRLFIAKSGFAKVNIALARGKKQFDKRQDLKEKQDKRAMERAMKI